MTGDEWRGAAGDVFTVSAMNDGQVRVEMNYADQLVDMTMEPEAAQWLAFELVKAARLPWPPPLRITRKSVGGTA